MKFTLRKTRLLCLVAVLAALWHARLNTADAADTPALQTFDSNGVKIAYVVQGQGEPVILIHGWLASAGVNWVLPGTFALLAKDFQVIALDVRGHGLSGKPTQVEAYGPELVEDIVRLLDHLKIEKAHLVGYSMGGIIALNFVAKHPDRVLSATLGGMGWLREESLEQKFFAMSRTNGQPLALCFRSLATLALTEEQLKSIRVPVQILFGDGDFLKKSYVEPVERVRKDWPVIDIRDANHITCIFKSQFKEEIQKWLVANRRK